MPIHVPMVDVRTVGAGGGSIARVDAGGLLQVGPESAGADPGPICYGRGGGEPTISDANMLLGRLNPTGLLAVDAPVPVERIRAIFAEKLGAPLGLSPEDAAEAVLRVANTRMAGAVRMVSLSLGADPRDFALFAFGGAGPLHASALARELGIPRVLVPARPGITNALGCVVADLRHDFVNTLNRPLDLADLDEVHRVFARQEAEGRRLIAEETVAVQSVEALFSAEMKFIGQTHQLRVPLPDGRPDRETLQRAFERVYRARFHVDLPEVRAALVNLNCSVIGRRPEVDLSALLDARARRPGLPEAETGRRRVRFAEGWHDTPVYRRDHLPAGAAIEGPAIVEQLDATTVIEPGDRATQDGDGNLLIALGAVLVRREPAMSGAAR